MEVTALAREECVEVESDDVADAMPDEREAVESSDEWSAAAEAGWGGKSWRSRAMA